MKRALTCTLHGMGTYSNEMSSETYKSILVLFITMCADVWLIHLTLHAFGPGRLATLCLESSPLAICWGGRADNSRTIRCSETHEAANQKSRRDSFVAYFKVESEGHVSVQGPVKHHELGA